MQLDFGLEYSRLTSGRTVWVQLYAVRQYSDGVRWKIVSLQKRCSTNIVFANYNPFLHFKVINGANKPKLVTTKICNCGCNLKGRCFNHAHFKLPAPEFEIKGEKMCMIHIQI